MIIYKKSEITKYCFFFMTCVMFIVMLLYKKIYSESINIYCPYCQNKKVEVLNYKEGICHCTNCERNMIIINDLIRTDDNRELSLSTYVIYDKEDNEDLLKQIIASRNEANKNSTSLKETDIMEGINAAIVTILLLALVLIGFAFCKKL